jgi:hypothetical protein
MTSSVFKFFKTSQELEKGGVWLTYDDTRFLVARAGGSNSKYADTLKAKLQPMRLQVERNMISAEEDTRLMIEIYVESVIKGVQVKDEHGKWVNGVPTEEGSVLPVTAANVTALLTALPDMFRDIRTCSMDANKYLRDQEAADLKNSNQS